MLILTPEEIRKAEDTANKGGLSYEEMMESAGSGSAEYILKNYPDAKNFVIFCGKGKNGGDGFVIARYLNECDKNVSVILAFNSHSDELSEKNKKRIDGLVNFSDGTKLTKRISSLIQNADIIIDAVFGIGFKGSLPENIKHLFALSKESKAVKIAIDIPSGLSCENENFSDCFKADETLSMLCFKKEHIYKPYSDLCGKVTVIPIGFSYISDGIQAKSAGEIKAMLPKRPFDANKGTFGKALIISGSYKMPGACVIATKGALTMGAGLTYLAFPDCIYNTVTAHLTECVFRPLASDKYGGFGERSFATLSEELSSFSAVAIGPGMGTDAGAVKLLKSVIKSYTGKLIIDADGINIISRNIDILKESKADIVLTPHPGEMARLTGLSVKEINTDRINIASEFSQRMNVTVLLKGVNTVIASPDGKVFINPTGSDALARGGSGDLLTGITVSLACQNLSSFDAAVTGAYIHGLAGETAKSLYTGYCATVERIYDCIPKALSKILSGQ
ncbi:MAG: NAD(P)H-hydrate dehydratase [Clostridia bacterium]|nr:NAD(P)H-hydrate dehydratase [Clostridia bacterium]